MDDMASPRFMHHHTAFTRRGYKKRDADGRGSSKKTQATARREKLPKILNILQPGLANDFDKLLDKEMEAHSNLHRHRRLVPCIQPTHRTMQHANLCTRFSAALQHSLHLYFCISALPCPSYADKSLGV
jgi:hypothetical protein